MARGDRRPCADLVARSFHNHAAAALDGEVANALVQFALRYFSRQMVRRRCICQVYVEYLSGVLKKISRNALG
jgi:hypothetical protein